MRHRPIAFAIFTLLSLVLAGIAPAYGQFADMYNFGTLSDDPRYAWWSGIIAQGRDGNLYSSTCYGGVNDGGAIFQITPAGALALLYSFPGPSGSTQPCGGLTLGTDGDFYGTTYYGGTNGAGEIFKITPSGTLTVLYSFNGTSDGANPYAPPVQGTDGNWYGTTRFGGTYVGGTAYKLTTSGTFKVLHQFSQPGQPGYYPFDPLVLGTDGNFYGTTQNDAVYDGVVFKLTPKSKYTVLHGLSPPLTDGAFPIAPLIQGSDGNFYGTAYDGGSANAGGVAFKITPGGKYTVLYAMGAVTSNDGVYPQAGLVQASDGNFYGANSLGGAYGCGTLFKLTPKAVFSVVHPFDCTDGNTPYVTLTQHTNGILYGDTLSGGTGSNAFCTSGTCGVFYSYNAGLPPFVKLLTASGTVGAQIGILGQKFDSSSVVKFGTAAATTVTLDGTTYLTATVPSGATTGSVSVTTSSGTLKSNQKFRVTPQITTLGVLSGIAGSQVAINGVSLIQTTSVTFAGVKATFAVNSDIQVTATVPSGAKTGKIAIATPGGLATSAQNFTVVPNIISFNPPSGPVGTTVTITGTSFTGATSVNFNGVTATFKVNSDTQITATVPTGATTGPITVTTPGGTATSSTNFTVT